MSAAFIERPEFRALQDALNMMPSASSTFWIGVGAFLLANLVLIPLELMAIAAGVLFGALRGSGVALLGSLVAATAGYLAGRAIGRAGLSRWMSRRAYTVRAATGHARCRRRARAAAGIDCQRRIDSLALRRGARAVRHVHRWHDDWPGAGDVRARRPGSAAAPDAARSVRVECPAHCR